MSRVYQSKSIDPNVSDSDLSNTSKALATLKISIRDATGAYKPFNDIMQEVANKEKTLTDSQKANLSYNMAGVAKFVLPSQLEIVG